MHRIEERPVARGGEVVIRPMMYLALSYDHRMVDGKDAVTFLVRVKEVIEEGVAQALVGRFGIDEIHVLAKPLETDLTKRLGALQQGPHMFQVTSLPLRSGGKREEVTYRIYFDVLGVHEKGWHTFRLKSFASPEEELERIKEILREDIRGVLDTVPSEVLQYIDVKIKQELERIFATTILKVVRTFGVVIAIVSLRREATRGEVAEHEVLAGDIEVNKRAALKAAESGAEARLEQLEMLERKEHELIEAGSESDDVELREVRRRIEELRSDLLAYPSKQEKQHVQPSALNDFDFKDYAQRILTAGEYKKQLQEKIEGEGL